MGSSNSELEITFELLKKFKPEYTSISISSGIKTIGCNNVEIEIFNEDPNLPEDYNEEDLVVIESFGYIVDASVIDEGIGSFQFLLYEIKSFKLTDYWPSELKWLMKIIEEKICEVICELPVE